MAAAPPLWIRLSRFQEVQFLIQYLSDPLLQDSVGGIIVIYLLLEALEERTVYSFRRGIGETLSLIHI